MSKRQGKFITLRDAQAEVQKFTDIQAATSGLIKTAIKDADAETKTYFEKDVLSFIFEKTLVEALFALSKDKGVNALRIYPAAAATASQDGDIKVGTSTVILVAAKLTYADDGDIIHVENVSFSEELMGIQYPGIVLPPPGTAPGTQRLSINEDKAKPLSLPELATQ
jgi:hypothetical protein